MRYRLYLKNGRRLLSSLRHFSDDPGKTFRDKGLAEENRYFMKKQREELRKLRESLKDLEERINKACKAENKNNEKEK